MESTTSDKEELRRRLRNKIQTKNAARTNQVDATANQKTATAADKLATAQNALMAVAGDDPELLRIAQDLMKNPRKAAEQLNTYKTLEVTAGAPQELDHKPDDDDSEEEAPHF